MRQPNAKPSAGSEPAQQADQTRPMREVEISLIRSVLQDCSGNVAEAALKLGMSRSTLYRRMNQNRIVRAISVD
jgi:DNA-binding NtrC family response regulator